MKMFTPGKVSISADEIRIKRGNATGIEDVTKGKKPNEDGSVKVTISEALDLFHKKKSPKADSAPGEGNKKVEWISAQKAATIIGTDRRDVIFRIESGHLKGSRVGRGWRVMRDSITDLKVEKNKFDSVKKVLSIKTKNNECEANDIAKAINLNVKVIYIWAEQFKLGKFRKTQDGKWFFSLVEIKKWLERDRITLVEFYEDKQEET
jgi:hypothetical protein